MFPRIHRHISNPVLYRDFLHLDLRAVGQYFLVAESVCVKLVDGRLQRRGLTHTEVPIDVR